ncbi:MAG TPA: class I SAM-dependent methyltransferase [Thermoanaerobaculia bacterium]|nr:class I SAM-dependent methyltransferase [Thermoanaerobaculia bacterium]
MPAPTCRSCGAALEHTFADLGVSPLANAYLAAEELEAPESFYPLHARVCTGCWLVQLPAAVPPEAIFSEYAYFSSYSESWLAHADRFAAAAVERFALGPGSRVVEVASNDGYLLAAFQRRDVPVLGIEPAANVARVAEERGIATRVRFFGRACAAELAGEGRRADLLVGNNVFAHVPDLHDFTAGLAALLAPGGVLSLEFPHLQRLVEGNQFDTIYHEHYSYFSFGAARRVLAGHGLEVFDVAELPTHGGSLRVLARRQGDGGEPVAAHVEELAARERALGYETLAPYAGFAARVQAAKRRLLAFLIAARESGRRVVGYGAPAKGNTLLVFSGVGPDLLEYTVDRSPHKQGRYLPGSRIPIHAPERILADRPDHVLILPWNLREEIAAQMAAVRDWGGSFLVAIPELEELA